MADTATPEPPTEAPEPPADVEGGPGWVIDGATLAPRITDVDAFRAGMATDPLAEAVELLWSGQAEAAREMLSRSEPTVRVRALRADCARDLGETELALQTYADVLAECAGTPWEPVLRQHHGKALLAAGRIDEALAEFEAAYEQRAAAGAPADLLASSAQARDRAAQIVASRH